VSWDQRLDRPVVLPDGKTLRTLEDARRYIITLPKSEHETTAWQVAIKALLIAAEKRDPVMQPAADEVHVHHAKIKISEGQKPPREGPLQ
jgi:hypothetical protein